MGARLYRPLSESARYKCTTRLKDAPAELGHCPQRAFIVLAVPVWVALAFVLRLRGSRADTEELADVAPKPPKLPDFSPMPRELAGFARLLEEALAV